MSCQLMDIWNMDLSHIPLAVRPSAHLSTYHRTFFQSRLTYGFVATPIYSKELEGDSCFASIHPANRNKIQFLHTNTGCPSDLVPQRKLFFPFGSPWPGANIFSGFGNYFPHSKKFLNFLVLANFKVAPAKSFNFGFYH